MKLEDKLMDALVYGKVNQIEKVFEEIYYSYYKLVYFCIKQHVNQKEDVEELANDTFVSFYNSLDRSTNITSIKAYLCKIANNKANDYGRKKKVIEEELSDNSSYTTPSYESDDIFDFLKSKLSDDEYYILIHHSIYEDTFKEIASDLNVSINTIKSTYRRLIKRLKGEHYENF